MGKSHPSISKRDASIVKCRLDPFYTFVVILPNDLISGPPFGSAEFSGWAPRLFKLYLQSPTKRRPSQLTPRVS